MSISQRLHSTEYIPAPKLDDIRQRQLSRYALWEAYDQELWVDARKVLPKWSVFKLPAWDKMVMGAEPIPDYPIELKPLDWTRYRGYDDWLQQIPSWVADSCRLFPSHQVTLLHYVAKYPPLLELLDHAPYLAWSLIKSALEEPEIVALLSGKRQNLVRQLGWSGQKETLKFLQNLRLRSVNPMIQEQVQVCLCDPQRLTALQALPRINSMALTLAARFPELIGSPLHLSLAKLPCRPMQCQSMIALLEDAFSLAARLQLPADEIAKIGNSRYLQDVHYLSLLWIRNRLQDDSALSCCEVSLAFTETFQGEGLAEVSDWQDLHDWSGLNGSLLAAWINTNHISSEPKAVTQMPQLLELSLLQEHAWWLESLAGRTLYVWQDSTSTEKVEDDKVVKKVGTHSSNNTPKSQINRPHQVELWAALVDQTELAPHQQPKVLKVRGLQNQLPTAKQLGHLHLFLAQKTPHF